MLGMDNDGGVRRVVEKVLKESKLDFTKREKGYWTLSLFTECFTVVRVGVSATSCGLLLSASLPISVRAAYNNDAVRSFVEAANRSNNMFTLIVTEDGEIACKTCMLLGAEEARELLLDLLDDLVSFVDIYGRELVCVAYAGENPDSCATTACAVFNAKPGNRVTAACSYKNREILERLSECADRFIRRFSLSTADYEQEGDRDEG